MDKTKSNEIDMLNHTEPISRVYLVRHGQTKANREGLIFGQWDLPLNDTGKKQVERAGKSLLKLTKGIKIDKVFSSPLKRARQSAKIISSAIGIKKVLLAPEMMEKSEGTFEGSSYWDLAENRPKELKKWLKDPYRQAPPKGESVTGLQKRVQKFQKKIVKDYLGKNIVVVSHSGPIRQFMLNVLGCDVDKFWNIKTENGSICEVHISKNHSMIWRINFR